MQIQDFIKIYKSSFNRVDTGVHSPPSSKLKINFLKSLNLCYDFFRIFSQWRTQTISVTSTADFLSWNAKILSSDAILFEIVAQEWKLLERKNVVSILILIKISQFHEHNKTCFLLAKVHRSQCSLSRLIKFSVLS